MLIQKLQGDEGRQKNKTKRKERGSKEAEGERDRQTERESEMRERGTDKLCSQSEAFLFILS